MSRKIITGNDMRKKLISGVNKLTGCVSSTLGPNGMDVIIHNHAGQPNVTNDGVTVANALDFEDPIENLGASIVKSISQKTCDLAGDGTTTSCILANAMLNEGKKIMMKGIFGRRTDPIKIKLGMNMAVGEINRYLSSQSRPISSNEDILKIAVVSSNNDAEIGGMIAEAYEKVTTEGVLTVERVYSPKTTVEIQEGYKIEKGYSNPEFINDKKNKTVSYGDGVYVLICPDKLEVTDEFIKIISDTINKKKGLLVICDEPSPEVYKFYNSNKNNPLLKMCIVACPGVETFKTELIEDMKVFVGGVVNSEGNILGYIDSFVSEHNKTTMRGGKGTPEEISERVEILRSRMDDKKPKYHDSILKDRMGWLSAKIAVMYVGAKSLIERGQLYDRIDDATRAVRSAIEEGTVIGGGYTFVKMHNQIKCSSDDRDVIKGFNIVRNSLLAPLEIICKNSSVGFKTIKDTITHTSYMFNMKTKQYEDVGDCQIFDPTKVIRVSIENAVSVCSTILLSETLIF